MTNNLAPEIALRDCLWAVEQMKAEPDNGALCQAMEALIYINEGDLDAAGKARLEEARNE